MIKYQLQSILLILFKLFSCIQKIQIEKRWLLLNILKYTAHKVKHMLYTISFINIDTKPFMLIKLNIPLHIKTIQNIYSVKSSL